MRGYGDVLIRRDGDRGRKMICESRGLDRVYQSTGSMYYNVADSVFPMLALQSAQDQADSPPLPAIHGEPASALLLLT